jgi:histone deacetylase complex subunit SAP30
MPRAQIQWSSFDPSILHGYRYDYRLNTTAAFNKQYSQMVLTNSPIGRMSPTMARHKQQRRQGKDQLANAVRKHFNSMGIIENEVVVDFLYKVRWQGECLLLFSSIFLGMRLTLDQTRISACDLPLNDRDRG